MNNRFMKCYFSKVYFGIWSIFDNVIWAALVAWFVKLASACIIICSGVRGKERVAWHVWIDLVRQTPVLGLNTAMPASDYTHSKSTDSVHGEWSLGHGVSLSSSRPPQSHAFPSPFSCPITFRSLILVSRNLDGLLLLSLTPNKHQCSLPHEAPRPHAPAAFSPFVCRLISSPSPPLWLC